MTTYTVQCPQSLTLFLDQSKECLLLVIQHHFQQNLVSHPGTDQDQPCLASEESQQWYAGWYAAGLVARVSIILDSTVHVLWLMFLKITLFVLLADCCSGLDIYILPWRAITITTLRSINCILDLTSGEWPIYMLQFVCVLQRHPEMFNMYSIKQRTDEFNWLYFLESVKKSIH
jgi:hypothetical protein